MAKPVDLLPPPKLAKTPAITPRTVAITPELHARLKKEALKRGYTLNGFIQEILKRALNGTED